ncbi:MAG: rRNA maturation RNase YbeY [Clostridiales bacterium]
MIIGLSIQNQQKQIAINKQLSRFLQKIARITMLKSQLSPYANIEISLILADDDSIQKLNAKYRQIDRPTDVLSFPMEDDLSPWYSLSCRKHGNLNKVILGDIIISTETAARQAVDYQHSLERELAFLFVHGLLHLLGYDHQNEADENEMRSRQREILTELGQLR